MNVFSFTLFCCVDFTNAHVFDSMLNAIQKVKMAMGKKKPKLSMRKPKLNPGFDALPSSVQKKMMKKAKMAMRKKK